METWAILAENRGRDVSGAVDGGGIDRDDSKHDYKKDMRIKTIADQSRSKLGKIALAAMAGALLSVGVAASSGQAQSLLTYYNFNEQTSGAANTATLTSDTPGLQTTTISTTFAAANVVVFGGTTVNRARGDTAGAGGALALQVGTSNVNNGKTAQFTVNATGAVGTDNSLTLSYATQTSGATGFTSEVLAYSLDGTTFTQFGSLTTLPTSFAAYSFALPTFASTDDLSALTIRFTFDGGTGASGNVRLDNIQFSEAPEPTTVLGGALMLGAAAWTQRRRLLAVFAA